MESSLSDYIIQGEVGRGSFGVVYKAINQIDQRIYILKKIHMCALSPKRQSDALYEVQILKTLDHPHIIKYYGSFLQDQTLHIIMEYAEGGDLQKHLRQFRQNKKKFAEKEIWRYAEELASAISYLHTRNIIHRDIKCLNILLTKDQQLKLADLGASRITDAQMLATRVGTPLYIAPELVKQRPYDFKVDIWALGCVIYQLACRESPFVGDNLISLGYSIVNRRPKQLPNNYSTKLNEFVMILLSKKPQDRPGIKEVIKMLPNQLNEPATDAVSLDLYEFSTELTLAKTLKEETLINTKLQISVQDYHPATPKYEPNLHVVRFAQLPKSKSTSPTPKQAKRILKYQPELFKLQTESPVSIKEKFIKPVQPILEITNVRPKTQPGRTRKVSVSALSNVDLDFSIKNPRITINPSPRELLFISPKISHTSRNVLRFSRPVKIQISSSPKSQSIDLHRINTPKLNSQDYSSATPKHNPLKDFKRPKTAFTNQIIILNSSNYQEIPSLSVSEYSRPHSALEYKTSPLFNHKIIKSFIRPPESLFLNAYKDRNYCNKKKLTVSDLNSHIA